ncbi:MAG: hypothetical protein RID42_07395 [Alphaproteobacteria bacterium]
MKKPARETPRITVHRGATESVDLTRKKWRYILIYLVAIPAVAAPIMLVFFLLLFGGSQIVRDTLVKIGREPVGIAYFGDSVLRAYSSCEANTDSIDTLLRERTSQSVVTIASAGYTVRQFSALARLFDKEGSAPRLAIVPLNLRSFSVIWFANPGWQFETEMQYARLVAGDWSGLPSFVFSSIAGEQLESGSFLDSPIEAGGTRYGTIAELSSRTSNVPLSLECTNETKQHDDALHAKFTMNYLFDVKRDHPLLESLSSFLLELRSNGVLPLVYITPVNIVEAERVRGPTLAEAMRRNVAAIDTWLSKTGAPYLNLAFDLEPEMFADTGCACEHLKYAGRRYVSERLAEAINEHFVPASHE